MPEFFFLRNAPSPTGKTTGQLAGESALALHQGYDSALGDLAAIDREFRETRALLSGPQPGIGGKERHEAIIEKLRQLDAKYAGKKLEIERIATELERKDPVFREIRQGQRDAAREYKEKKAQEDKRQAEQTRQRADQQRKDEFRRWMEDYDRRRYDAKKLQDREDFARSIDLERLANLEFLAQMGAIDKVSGFGAVSTSKGGQTGKLEGQLRLVENATTRKARTDDLKLTRHATSRLDPAALDFLPTGHQAKLGA